MARKRTKAQLLAASPETLLSINMTGADCVDFEVLQPQEGTAEVRREWSMLAHTGKVVQRWWGDMVLDLDGADFKPKLALLKDHNASAPIGFSTKVERTPRGIEASGKLLACEEADTVIAYSKQGFPWQASLMAVPLKVENVPNGATAKVNGGEVKGPLTIFRTWRIGELTITTLGADDDTKTQAFAQGGENQDMVTKTTNAPTTSSEVLTAQVPTPTQPTQPSAEDLATAATASERERSKQILQSADPVQSALAASLVSEGVPLAQALARLNADLRERLAAAGSMTRVAAEPIGAGNARSDTLASEGGLNFAALEAGDEHNVEELKGQWSKTPALRKHFSDERVFLAWHKNRHKCTHFGRQIESLSGSELLAGSLGGMGYRNVQGRYYLSYEDALGGLWSSRIVTEVTTDQAQEIHKWIGTPPNPEKWRGERGRRQLTDYGITVVGDKYESTVSVDLDDLRRDKTGQLLKRIGEMGTKMATLPQRLLSMMIESSVTAYDGLSFWNTAHTVGQSGSQSNDITVSGLSTPDAPTTAGMVTAILTGIQTIMGMKDDRGDPMNEGSSKFVLLMPTKYWQVALGALRNDFTSAGVNNTLVNANLTIAPFVSSRLSGAASAAGRRIYLFREDAEVRSLIWQEENIPDGFKSQDAFSDSGFWKDSVAYGGKRISSPAPGRFELACRVNLAA